MRHPHSCLLQVLNSISWIVLFQVKWFFDLAAWIFVCPFNWKT
ncbi:hypothetical protein SLEP1_g60238 [Rubroshorea leprosula]|uniref:Uncharacterized protein n=1 Tax=Rubroshorea leprosula TaxID=152421 RepID=A0AAV5MUR1_9ROSI|nr:hypothetical protein SLEP1_g60238 [Rubroshorea leprosula]